MEKLLDTNLLRVFCEICYQKQLNLAAHQLGMTTSAVSQAVAKLEGILNVELFLHDRRPLKLTAAGERLFREGEPIVKASIALQESFRLLEMPQISLRMGLGETVTATLSPWLVSEIQHRISRLEVHSGLNKTLTKALKNGELDLCVYSEALLHESCWYRLPIYEEDYLLVSSARIGEVSTIGALRDVAIRFPYVSYTADSYDRQQADQFLQSINVTPRTQMQIASSFSVSGLVDLSDGWTVMPATNLWSGGEFSKRLLWHPLPQPYTLHRRMWVLGAPDRKNEIQWVTDMTRSLFKEHTLPEIEKISPALLEHVRMLPEVSRAD